MRLRPTAEGPVATLKALLRYSWFVLAALVAAPLHAQGDSVPPVKQRPLLAVVEVLGVNFLVNRFDAWALGEWWAQEAGPDSWADNFKLGWEWDEDNFTTNMFAHPYHGSMYFNAGRSNGLNFWESSPLAFLGSWTWEYLGEAKRPSLNDFFNTSFGGIALGEMLHRVSASIRDNEARGTGRTLREIAALPFDPIGGFNRLIRGEWSKRFANPDEHNPGSYVLRVNLGVRFAEGLVQDSAEQMAVLLVDLISGDGFRHRYRKPFDVFGVRMLISGDGGFDVLRASGRLFAKDLNDSMPRWRHIFQINQRFDYIDNPAHAVGGQSVELGIASRWRFGDGFGIRTGAYGDVILMGAIDAPGAGLGERYYDFGPGGGVRLELALERRNVRYFTVHGRSEYIHSVSGASADHIIAFVSFEGTLPLVRGLGLAAHLTHFTRTSYYEDGLVERRDYPELRLMGVWTKAGFR